MPGTWKNVTIAGHPGEVFEPQRPHPGGFAVVYLHGVHLAQLSANEAFTQEFERHGLRVVCPRTGPCWWADRPCPEFDSPLTPEQYVRQEVLRYIETEYRVAPPRIGLLGTSMGGQGALRMAFKHPSVFPVAAAISPAIDYHLRIRENDPVLIAMYGDEESARQDTALLHVHALNWPRHTWFCCDPADFRWHESAYRLQMKLGSLGIPYESDLSTTHGGHGFEYYNHMAPKAVEFLVRRLEQERLRLA